MGGEGLDRDPDYLCRAQIGCRLLGEITVAPVGGCHFVHMRRRVDSWVGCDGSMIAYQMLHEMSIAGWGKARSSCFFRTRYSKVYISPLTHIMWLRGVSCPGIQYEESMNQIRTFEDDVETDDEIERHVSKDKLIYNKRTSYGSRIFKRDDHGVTFMR